MFERLEARVRDEAERRVEARVQELAEQLRAEGVRAEPVREGVQLLGRGLRRRFVLEPALRWLGLR